MFDDDDDLIFGSLDELSLKDQNKVWKNAINQIQAIESEYIRYYKDENFSSNVFDSIQILINLCNDWMYQFGKDKTKVRKLQEHLQNANLFLKHIGQGQVNLATLSNHIDALSETISLNNFLVLDFKKTCESLSQIRVDKNDESLARFKDALSMEKTHLNDLLIKNQSIYQKIFDLHPPKNDLNQKIIGAFVCLSKNDFFNALEINPNDVGFECFFDESIK